MECERWTLGLSSNLCMPAMTGKHPYPHTGLHREGKREEEIENDLTGACETNQEPHRMTSTTPAD